jgi:asparagine synthase (glutamine-hydrolysing)
VRQIAELNGNIDPHFVAPSNRPIIEHIAEEIRVGGFPGGGILNGLWVMDIVAAARSSGHDVMLIGEMGNDTISYNGRTLLAELVRRGRWLRLCREIASSGRQWRKMLRHHTIAPFIPRPIFRWYKRRSRAGKPPWYNLGAIRLDFAAQSGIVDRAAREYLPFDAPLHRTGRKLRINELHCFCDTADWFAKLRAEYEIDMRAPAFDRRLFELCIGIPEDQFLRKGCQRWLIKRAMQGRLPDSVLSNTRTGAQAADWFVRLTREREQIGAELKRLTGNPEVSSLIDLQRLIRVVDHWPERQPETCSADEYLLLWVPQALGAANFIETVTGTNRQ